MEKVKKEKVKIMNDRKVARDIVREILSFGVNQEQIVHVIYLLSLNLEDNEKMKEISLSIKKVTEAINEEEREGIINSKSKIILEWGEENEWTDCTTIRRNQGDGRKFTNRPD